MKKLSGRPFLVVNFFERPKENVNTATDTAATVTTQNLVLADKVTISR